jgi:hypothetical protein
LQDNNHSEPTPNNTTIANQNQRWQHQKEWQHLDDHLATNNANSCKHRSKRGLRRSKEQSFQPSNSQKNSDRHQQLKSWQHFKERASLKTATTPNTITNQLARSARSATVAKGVARQSRQQKTKLFLSLHFSSEVVPVCHSVFFLAFAFPPIRMS